MMLPLAAQTPGDHWPQSIELKLDDSRVIVGQVAWIYAIARPFERHWTDDPRGLAIRAILPTDDSSTLPPAGFLGPYLLARIPTDANGELHLNNQILKPAWADVPDIESLDSTNRTLAPDRPTLTLTPSPDRPDPVSPFEYWRWVLLADRLDMNPPAPFGGDIERLAAEHYAALWRIGLGRLAGQSDRIASQCRDVFTRTCIDHRGGAEQIGMGGRPQPFAAWLADPAQVSSILSRLVDFNRPATTALSDAATWLDEQPPLYLWKAAEDISQAHIAVLSMRDAPLIAHVKWRLSTQPPIEIQIEPGVLLQLKIDRPPPPHSLAAGLPAPAEPPQSTLEIGVAGRQWELTFGPRIVVAKPPGVFLQALAPPLTLADVQSGRIRGGAAEYATSVHVRKLGGRWEVFFESRHPASAAPTDAASGKLPESLRSLEDVRGIEAVTLLLGGVGRADNAGDINPSIWLTVPENGFWKLTRGVNDGTLQVHRRSFADRWYCRIVLPDSWCVPEHEGRNQPLLLGCLRSHIDSNQIETGPNITLPWRVDVSRAAIDISQWDDLPQAE